MNKCLLVTGASSEVGLRFLSEKGRQFERIIAHYCHLSEPLRQLKEKYGEKMYLVQADFTSLDSTLNMIKELKQEALAPGYILHLPSAKYHNSKFHRVGFEGFGRELDIQLRSITLILQAFLPQMVRAKSGRIVFLLSSCTEGTAPCYLSDYVTVKYALLGLMRALAAEYAGKGIAVNAVSPGMMETKLLSEIPELIVQQNAAANPYGRNVRIDDILPPLSLLLSERAEMMSGQNLVISGGR